MLKKAKHYAERVLHMLYSAARAVIYFIFLIIYRFKVYGSENLPYGRVIICANHTSLADPILAALSVKTKERLYFMAKAELFKNPLFGGLIRFFGAFPIDRGASDIGAIKHTLGLLKAEKKILMFPQGTRFSSSEKMALKSGAAMLSLKTGTPILPMYITTGRKMFINRIEVRIGVPFTPCLKQDQDKSLAYDEISVCLGEKIEELGKQGADF